MRELAREAGLPVADKRESQDLCFLAGLGGRAVHAAPRRAAAPRSPGEIVDRGGRVLGRHDGQHHFTVGQRRGLGVAAAEPLYVLGKDAEPNRVVVGPRAALATRPRASRGRRACTALPREVETVRAALPRRADRLPCADVAGETRSLELELERRASAVAPGQIACLMRGDRVVGEGTIGEPQ